MTTEQIIWIVVILVAALAVIGFIVSSMRKKSQQDNRVRATELREQADTEAAVIPDAQARARETDAQAEQARLQAERAEARAEENRSAVAQQEAIHEDQVRAADRLDPDVDHKAKDYTPGTHAVEHTESEGPTTEPDAVPEPDWTDPDQRGGTTGGTTGGSHRA